MGRNGKRGPIGAPDGVSGEFGGVRYGTLSGFVREGVVVFPGWRFAYPGLCYGIPSGFVGICSIGHSFFHLRRLSFIIYHSPFIIRHSPFIIRHSPFIIRHSPFIIRH